MERMLNVDVSQISATKSYIMFYDKITAAVDIHRRALESVYYNLKNVCYANRDKSSKIKYYSFL